MQVGVGKRTYKVTNRSDVLSKKALRQAHKQAFISYSEVQNWLRSSPVILLLQAAMGWLLFLRRHLDPESHNFYFPLNSQSPVLSSW